MYNRYIPQPDGSHLRQPTKEPPMPPAPRPEPPQHQPEPPKPPEHHRPPEPPREPEKHHGSPPPPPPERHHGAPPPARHPAQGGGHFLSRILPPGFDTGDLLVVALLLLMAGDNPEQKNTALLTLAMYFIL